MHHGQNRGGVKKRKSSKKRKLNENSRGKSRDSSVGIVEGKEEGEGWSSTSHPLPRTAMLTSSAITISWCLLCAGLKAVAVTPSAFLSAPRLPLVLQLTSCLSSAHPSIIKVCQPSGYTHRATKEISWWMRRLDLSSKEGNLIPDRKKLHNKRIIHCTVRTQRSFTPWFNDSCCYFVNGWIGLNNRNERNNKISSSHEWCKFVLTGSVIGWPFFL